MRHFIKCFIDAKNLLNAVCKFSLSFLIEFSLVHGRNCIFLITTINRFSCQLQLKPFNFLTELFFFSFFVLFGIQFILLILVLCYTSQFDSSVIAWVFSVYKQLMDMYTCICFTFQFRLFQLIGFLKQILFFFSFEIKTLLKTKIAGRNLLGKLLSMLMSFLGSN